MRAAIRMRPSGSLKVLIVDDEPSVLASTAMLLEDRGFVVVKLADASAVLDTMRRERPDALLQDVRMPGLDVDALVDAVRRQPDLRHTPVILFSASLDLEERAEKLGVDVVLEKPFRPDDLVAALARAAPSP